jgi:CIC family chloride channel protein
MFALEIVLGDFGLATFSPIVISSVAATAVSRYFLGDAPAFIVPAYELISAWELPLYVILGLFCALVGVTFTKVLYRLEDMFDELKFPEYLKAALGGLILGVMALVFPHLLGVGYEAIDLALIQELSWWLMLLLVMFKILATSITIGSGGSGGIFAPSLFMGAMAGGFFGTGVHAIFPGMTASPGAYSIVGMGAVVSATTHGPLSAILILFELTGDYKIILPLMIACIIGSLASGRLFVHYRLPGKWPAFKGIHLYIETGAEGNKHQGRKRGECLKGNKCKRRDESGSRDHTRKSKHWKIRREDIQEQIQQLSCCR